MSSHERRWKIYSVDSYVRKIGYRENIFNIILTWKRLKWKTSGGYVSSTLIINSSINIRFENNIRGGIGGFISPLSQP